MAITQKQLAELAGVSRGTVDRVLNNRGHVNPDVSARILRLAENTGYHLNTAGSLLVRTSRPVKLGIIVQSIDTPFMANVLQEIEAICPFYEEQGIELLIRSNPGSNEHLQLSLMDELKELGISGLAISPVESEAVCAKLNEFVKNGVPVITFNSDIPESQRLCYVGQNNYISGRTCAGLMGLVLHGSGKVLMITGHMFNRAHRQRIDGFQTEMMLAFPGITLLPLRQCNDNNETAYQTVLEILKNDASINGIYCSANGQSGICQAIQELNRVRDVHFICHDLIVENVRNVSDGIIDFLIDQDAHAQATKPIKILFRKVLFGERPSQEYNFVKIDIRNKYNICF